MSNKLTDTQKNWRRYWAKYGSNDYLARIKQEKEDNKPKYAPGGHYEDDYIPTYETSYEEPVYNKPKKKHRVRKFVIGIIVAYMVIGTISNLVLGINTYIINIEKLDVTIRENINYINRRLSFEMSPDESELKEYNRKYEAHYRKLIEGTAAEKYRSIHADVAAKIKVMQDLNHQFMAGTASYDTIMQAVQTVNELGDSIANKITEYVRRNDLSSKVYDGTIAYAP